MRPSQVEGIAGYTNTAAERDVIHDAVMEPHNIMTQTIDPRRLSNQDSTIIRLWEETQRCNPVFTQCFGFGIVIASEVGENPEIPIRDEDVHFVLKAAERVLKDRSVHGILHNSYTGRLRAARGMMRFFAEAGYPEAIVYQGLYGRTAVAHRNKMA